MPRAIHWSILVTYLFLPTLGSGILISGVGARVLVSSGGWKCSEAVSEALRSAQRGDRVRREAPSAAPWEVLEDVWHRIEAEKAQEQREKARSIPNIFAATRKKGKKRRRPRAVPTTLLRPLKSAPGVDAAISGMSMGAVEVSAPSGCTFERGDFGLPKAKVTVVFGKVMVSGRLQMRGRLHATEGSGAKGGNLLYAECDMSAWVRDLVVTIWVRALAADRREGSDPEPRDVDERLVLGGTKGSLLSTPHIRDAMPDPIDWRSFNRKAVPWRVKWVTSGNRVKWPTRRRRREVQRCVGGPPSNATEGCGAGKREAMPGSRLRMKADAVVSGRPKVRFRGCSGELQKLKRTWESELQSDKNIGSRTPELALLQQETEELFFNGLKHVAVSFSEKTVSRILSSSLAAKMGYILSYG